MSLTTCSASAELSTIIAFCPPVSAISGTSGVRAASACAIALPTAVDPVKATPATRASATSRAPIVSPEPGINASASGGTPAASSVRIACAAISVVCSAGLATTALPAASAAAIWPVKMASGKFHGEMHANTPRPRNASVFASPVGDGKRKRRVEAQAGLRRVVAAEIGSFAHFGNRCRTRLAGFARQQRNPCRAIVLDEPCCAVQDRGALLRGARVPRALARDKRVQCAIGGRSSRHR